MPIHADQLEALVRDAFPEAQLKLEDMAGDGDHYRLTLITPAFRGKSKLAQHRMVHDALKGRLGGELHALMLITKSDEP
ncbi:MAG: BolA family transcriptional regulator [Alphaproteobacteria bacterium]|nr:BolA family transcriptional regulator [Alphaproteobacteria bacterium]